MSVTFGAGLAIWENAYGGLAMQSLHVSQQGCVTALVDAL